MSAPRGAAPDDLPHDAWLRAALRHAPDADAVPPAALSEAILREAHAAAGGASARQRPAASIARRLLAAWRWLARPPVAAAFASLMVATVVGVMWWDRPLEEALPPREAPQMTTTPALPTGPMRDEAAPAAPTSPPATDSATRPATPPPAARVAPKAAEPRRAPAVVAPPRPSPPVRIDEAPAQAAPERDEARPREAEPQRLSGEAERRSAGIADAANGASSSAPAVMAAAAPPPEAPTKATAEKPSAAGAAAPAPPSPAAAARAFARRDAVAPLGPLRASLAAHPERWAWQREGGAAAPVSTALVQWLQRVDETARGRWMLQPGRQETAAATGTTIQLLQDGRAHTTLRLFADAVELDGPAEGPRQRAALPRAEATALRVELDQATR